MEDDILQKEPNDDFKLFHIHQEKPEPSIMVPVKVSGVSFSMEPDTGASVSIMSAGRHGKDGSRKFHERSPKRLTREKPSKLLDKHWWK